MTAKDFYFGLSLPVVVVSSAAEPVSTIDVVMDLGSKTITTGLPSEFFARTKKAVGAVSICETRALQSSLYLSLLQQHRAMPRWRRSRRAGGGNKCRRNFCRPHPLIRMPLLPPKAVLAIAAVIDIALNARERLVAAKALAARQRLPRGSSLLRYATRIRAEENTARLQT